MDLLSCSKRRCRSPLPHSCACVCPLRTLQNPVTFSPNSGGDFANYGWQPKWGTKFTVGMLHLKTFACLGVCPEAGLVLTLILVFVEACSFRCLGVALLLLLRPSARGIDH